MPESHWPQDFDLHLIKLRIYLKLLTLTGKLVAKAIFCSHLTDNAISHTAQKTITKYVCVYYSMSCIV